MPRPAPLAVTLLATAGLALLFAGGPPARSPRTRGGPAPVRTYARDCAGKPQAHHGTVEVAVVDRPAADTAVVRADWTRRATDLPTTLELLLPEGAVLLEGVPWQTLSGDALAGACTFSVRFLTDRTSDVVVRLSAVEQGQSLTREAYARLWEQSQSEAP